MHSLLIACPAYQLLPSSGSDLLAVCMLLSSCFAEITLACCLGLQGATPEPAIAEKGLLLHCQCIEPWFCRAWQNSILLPPQQSNYLYGMVTEQRLCQAFWAF